MKYYTLLSLTLVVLLNSEFMRIEPVRDNRVSYFLQNPYFFNVLSMIWAKFAERKVDALLLLTTILTCELSVPKQDNDGQ